MRELCKAMVGGRVKYRRSGSSHDGNSDHPVASRYQILHAVGLGKKHREACLVRWPVPALRFARLKKILQTLSMTKSQAKIAIIPGGSRGLGRSIVLNLAKRGVDSIFTYHSNRPEAGKVS